MPTPSGSGSNGSVSKVEASYSAPSSCSHDSRCCISGDRNPQAFQLCRYSRMRAALGAKDALEEYSFPSCCRPWTPTSKPACCIFSRRASGRRYSPSGTKLKEDRKPYFASKSINCSTRTSPLVPSTSCVRTTANRLPWGHPGHPGGTVPALSSIGHTSAKVRRQDFARHCRQASRRGFGKKGFRR